MKLATYHVRNQLVVLFVNTDLADVIVLAVEGLLGCRKALTYTQNSSDLRKFSINIYDAIIGSAQSQQSELQVVLWYLFFCQAACHDQRFIALDAIRAAQQIQVCDQSIDLMRMILLDQKQHREFRLIATGALFEHYKGRSGMPKNVQSAISALKAEVSAELFTHVTDGEWDE